MNVLKTASCLLKGRGWYTLTQEMNSQWEVSLPINRLCFNLLSICFRYSNFFFRNMLWCSYRLWFLRCLELGLLVTIYAVIVVIIKCDVVNLSATISLVMWSSFPKLTSFFNNMLGIKKGLAYRSQMHWLHCLFITYVNATQNWCCVIWCQDFHNKSGHFPAYWEFTSHPKGKSTLDNP